MGSGAGRWTAPRCRWRSPFSPHPLPPSPFDLLGPEQDGRVSARLLADGAPELWNLFDRYLNEPTLGVVPIKLIDAWHALEYVGAAARFLESRQRAWPGSFVRWKCWLLTEPDGVGRVLGALGDAGLHEARDESGARPMGDARWKPTTGNEVLQLRALQLSDRWEQAMKRVLRPLRNPVHVLTREQALGRAA